MCLAIPMKVCAVEEGSATVEQDGVRLQVGTMLLSEPLNVGDYVIVHAGFALQRLDEEAAQETLELFAQMAQLVQEEDEALDNAKNEQ
jgi:hydrogenase expression/formation protein HypC